MRLSSQDFIFLDFQTTGTVASTSDVIEAGWGLYKADDRPEGNLWTTRLIALSGERTLSRTIQRLTGLSAEYYSQEPAISPETLQDELRAFLAAHARTPLVIHFAQFKLPFLWKVIGGEESVDRDAILARVICVHKLSRLMIPELKSFSLRAVAGFAGYATAEKKRSVDHLMATAYVWRFIANKFADDEVPDDLVPWLKALERREAQALPIHGDALRKKRLSLPKAPGVYFFLDAFQNILYVGKAADLKARVNSYFRGQKTKGSRLNEMLTRAVDFRFVEVESELEALLLENDEIKRHDPPYNRLLRVEGRTVQTIRFNDVLPQPATWGFRRWGPLSSLSMIEALRPFMDESWAMMPLPAFITGVTGGMLQEAIRNIFLGYGLEEFESGRPSPSPDDWHRLAAIVWPLEYARLLELRMKADEDRADQPGGAEEIEEPPEQAEQTEWTTEDVETYLRQAFKRLLRQLFRSRWYLRISHCRLEWAFASSLDRTHGFTVRLGQIRKGQDEDGSEMASYRQRLAAFDTQVYDRVSILYAELKKGIRRGDRIKMYIGKTIVLDESELKGHLRF